ncbi:hypothetical protein GK047_04765 [Paenibacillus sp. SYP-B3998]|uniref:Beta/gamma crystallin family protein n=1 Tax=Paenibacillus sp. SYP-B3998 TaxID=2678564 RepID=A0A6G3ZTD8_9BACL|nr:hypothetical protein [Paenibacillus sp. SYP-B3998]NEW05330.1 hypothetical protein [Paenibacillus sp. SYP-B3998]
MKEMLRRICLNLGFISMLLFSFVPISSAVTEQSNYVSIDGEKTVSASSDGTVNVRLMTGDENGNDIQLGFTSEARLLEYIQHNPQSTKNVSAQGTGACCTDFYYDSDKGGGYRYVAVGDDIRDIGISWAGWDNRISSLSTAATGYTVLWQFEDFSGFGIYFDNAQYYNRTVNLGDYQMEPGRSWNDKASSIQVRYSRP